MPERALKTTTEGFHSFPSMQKQMLNTQIEFDKQERTRCSEFKARQSCLSRVEMDHEQDFNPTDPYA